MLYYLYYNIIEDKYYLKKLYLMVSFLGCIISLYLIYEYFFISKTLVFTQQAYSAQHEVDLGAWSAYQETLASERKAGEVLSWLGGTNGRAMILLLLYSYTLAISCFSKVPKYKLLKILTLTLLTVAMVLQVSRSVYGYLMIINVCFLYLTLPKRKSMIKNILFILILCVLFFYAIGESSIAESKMSKSIIGGSAYEGRIELIKEAFSYAGESFFLVNGFDSVVLDIDYLISNFEYLGIGKSHNLYIELIVDVGVFGFLFFILFIRKLIVNANFLMREGGGTKISLDNGLALKLIIICLALCGLTSHNILKTSMYLPVFIVLSSSISKLSLLSKPVRKPHI
jgi:hypothetical protein